MDVEPGISAEAVTIVHLHTRLEELERIGFAAPVGEVDAMVWTFVDISTVSGGGSMADGWTSGRLMSRPWVAGGSTSTHSGRRPASKRWRSTGRSPCWPWKPSPGRGPVPDPDPPNLLQGQIRGISDRDLGAPEASSSPGSLVTGPAFDWP
ncbi:MAG: hypothetical protein Ct9H300mP12_00300 [Acidimicrobiales bacterium]|nr:MAG: hypothetical protein Ct9H300mP12_00300 [Acidimicrobiales bacterium]